MPDTIQWQGHTLDVDRTLLELERMECEESLYTFLEHAWRFIDPAPFKPGWVIDALAEHLEAVCDGDIRRLLINIPPRCSKSSICSVAFPAWVWAQKRNTPTSGPRVPFLHASYGYNLSLRDSVKCRRLIKSTWYRRLWGHRFDIVKEQDQKIRFRNDKDGERLITSIGSGVTGEGGNIIIVDDANAADEVLSDAVIKSTNEDWWDGTMGTRLNDQKTGAFVVVQQRLGENDLSGHIMEKEGSEWVHLMLPMEYEPERSFVTSIGWKDPRTEAGELLWPERFGHEEIENLRRRLGPWKCTPGESPVLMADLSQRPIRDIKVGDKIVGFDKKTRTDTFGRRKLTEATVTDIHSFVAPVVKMTLDSGEVIRCTRDHKWYMKNRGDHRPMYLPVTLGRSRLARVCPPRLPELTAEEQRRAGWLAGFFDGEGSVSLQHRPADEYPPGAIISFYQGAGRNKPLCDKLEENLCYFGFEFSYTEDERKPNKDAPCYGYRNYRLKSDGLPTLQRFLHIVQPTKWRDRIESAAYKANFIKGREKVISIEPDGEEVVYGLTTTTGNYVVWGLASSNSAGQLQQRPEPAGGGIIKREWWQLWPPGGESDDPLERMKKPLQFPPFSFIIGYLDTGYTEKTMNDPSAMTVWGVFSSESLGTAAGEELLAYETRTTITDRTRTAVEFTPRVMLMGAWAERLELNPLVLLVNKTCRQFRVDLLVIENKAAGISVGQELKRLFRQEDYSVHLDDPKGMDKIARLYSVQHLFAEKMVFAPDRPWAEMVMAQCGTFPNAKNDDLVDTTSGSLRKLRNLGMLSRLPEVRRELESSLVYEPKPKRLYPS